MRTYYRAQWAVTRPQSEAAVTNARLSYAPRAVGRPLLPLDHARSASQTARSSRAANSPGPQERRASVFRGDGRCAPAAMRYALLSALRSTSPLADREPKPHQALQNRKSLAASFG